MPMSKNEKKRTKVCDEINHFAPPLPPLHCRLLQRECGMRRSVFPTECVSCSPLNLSAGCLFKLVSGIVPPFRRFRFRLGRSARSHVVLTNFRRTKSDLAQFASDERAEWRKEYNMEMDCSRFKCFATLERIERNAEANRVACADTTHSMQTPKPSSLHE